MEGIDANAQGLEGANRGSHGRGSSSITRCYGEARTSNNPQLRGGVMHNCSPFGLQVWVGRSGWLIRRQFSTGPESHPQASGLSGPAESSG